MSGTVLAYSRGDDHPSTDPCVEVCSTEEGSGISPTGMVVSVTWKSSPMRRGSARVPSIDDDGGGGEDKDENEAKL